MNYDITFNEFLKISADAIKKGIFKIDVPKPLSMLDMAVMYANGRIGNRKGYPCTATEDEIIEEITAFADNDIFSKTEGWFYEQL